MKTTSDFLDALRNKLDLPSDGRLADHLGMHRQHISRYRTMNGTFDDATSIRIAELLDLDPPTSLLVCTTSARHTPEKKPYGSASPPSPPESP